MTDFKVKEQITASSEGMKNYLLFVGLATAARRYYNGSGKFLNQSIHATLQEKYKPLFEKNRKTRKQAEKAYKQDFEALERQHNRYGKDIQRMCDLFETGEPVYNEELLACYINDFADAIIKIKK